MCIRDSSGTADRPLPCSGPGTPAPGAVAALDDVNRCRPSMALPDSGGFRERQLILTYTSSPTPRAVGGRAVLSAPGAADRLLAEAPVRAGPGRAGPGRAGSGLSSGSVTP